MRCERHDWRETGRRGVFIERVATWVRCSDCGQVGFRFDPSRVVYTWEQR